MSNSIYPKAVRGLTFTVLLQDQWDTIVQNSPNGYATRVAQFSQPLHHWTLIYDYLKNDPNDIGAGLTYTDLLTLRGFYNARQGQFDDFLFVDWTDPTDGIISGGTLQLVNDGSGNYYSPIQKSIAGEFWEDLTDLQPAGGLDHSALVVKANGVTQTYGSNYTLAGPGLAIPGASFLGLYLAWTAMPTAPITATFNYFYRVRWASDDQDFERFMELIWTIGGQGGKNGKGTLELITARPAGA